MIAVPEKRIWTPDRRGIRNIVDDVGLFMCPPPPFDTLVGGASGCGLPFNPATLNPSMWLQGGNYTNSTGTWRDSSGNGRDAVQSTSGNRPADATLNGLTIPDFDGTDDNLTNSTALSTLLSASAWTCWALVNIDAISTTSADATCWLNDAICSDTGAFWGMHVHNTTPSIKGYQFDTGAKVATATISLSTTFLAAMRYDGTNIRLSVNGGTAQTVASGNLGGTTGTLRIGRNFGSEFYDGRIADFGLVPTSTSDTVIQTNLRVYVNARYNLNL